MFKKFKRPIDDFISSVFSYSFLDFWNRFNTIGKVSIIGILLLIFYGFYIDNFDNLHISKNNSNGSIKQQQSTSSISTNSNIENSESEDKFIAIYDPFNPYTQESTYSKEIGPWLNSVPKGTRFCRSYDGTIQKLYPPGVEPYAKKVDIDCFRNSKIKPQLLNSSTK
jgi:hypothetical protein